MCVYDSLSTNTLDENTPEITLDGLTRETVPRREPRLPTIRDVYVGGRSGRGENGGSTILDIDNLLTQEGRSPDDSNGCVRIEFYKISETDTESSK